jgi:signal transduction histidine kinase
MVSGAQPWIFTDFLKRVATLPRDICYARISESFRSGNSRRCDRLRRASRSGGRGRSTGEREQTMSRLAHTQILFAAVLLQVCLEPLCAAPVTSLDELYQKRPPAIFGTSVQLRAVVTLALPERFDFAIQQEGEGIYATVLHDRTNEDLKAMRQMLRPGDVVSLLGSVQQGGYRPTILVTDLEVLDHGPLPAAIPAEFGRLFRGADTGKRIVFEGIVQAVEDQRPLISLLVDVDAREVLVMGRQEDFPTPLNTLVDSVVRITGVSGTVRNTRGEFLRPAFWVTQAEDIGVVTPAPTSVFEAPFRNLESLADYRAGERLAHRVRTRGVVTLSLPGQVLYLQQGLTGIRVATTDPRHFAEGDLIEASGFITMDRQVAGLTQAAVQRLGSGPPLQATAVGAEEVREINVLARARGQIAKPSDYDGCLITCNGLLAEVRPLQKAGPPELIVTADSRVLSVICAGVSASQAQRLAELQPGSQLKLTGILELSLQSEAVGTALTVYPLIQNTRLLIRSVDDIVVLTRPSWWTPRRLGVTIFGLLAALAAVGIWVWQLRSRVISQTQKLAMEVQKRHDAAVDFAATMRERNRLAANLHDTLLQSLAGIEFQVGAVAETPTDDARPGSSIEPRKNQLLVARRMIQHATRELRESVWALRTSPLLEGTFRESVTLVCRQLAAGHTEKIILPGADAFPEPTRFVAGHLLLVVQELVRNALRHARAGTIRVEVSAAADGNGLSLTVADDGCGFILGKQAGPTEGHFGIIGITERIELLSGRLTIKTAPGSGTVVQVDAPLRSYDPEIADHAETPPVPAPSVSTQRG